jgi:hypothetical protein
MKSAEGSEDPRYQDQTQVTGRKPQKHKWPLVAGTGLQIKNYGNPHLLYGGAKKLLQ